MIRDTHGLLGMAGGRARSQNIRPGFLTLIESNLAYSSGDFTSGSGLSVTSVTYDAPLWTVTMTDSNGSASAVFSSAEMTAIEAGTAVGWVRDAVVTLATGTYTVTSPAWFFHSDSVEVETQNRFFVSGVLVQTGDTFTPTGSQPVETTVFETVENLTFTELAETLYTEGVPTLYPVTDGGSAVGYVSAMAQENYTAIAMSFTDLGDASSFLFPVHLRTTAGSVRISIYRGSTGEWFVLAYPPTGTAFKQFRANFTSVGMNVAILIVGNPDGTASVIFADSDGSYKLQTETILAGSTTLYVADDMRVGRTSGGLSNTIAYNRVAYWRSSTAPTRTPTQVFADLFHPTTRLPREFDIGDFHLGTPIIDIRNPAAEIWAGTQEGIFAGTVTQVSGTGFIDYAE